MSLVTYRTALIHELGHACAAQILGLDVLSMYISAPRIGMGLFLWDPTALLLTEIRGAYQRNGDAIVILSGAELAAAELAIAGVAAELVVSGYATIENALEHLARPDNRSDRAILNAALPNTLRHAEVIAEVIEYLRPHRKLLIARAEALEAYVRTRGYGVHLWLDLCAFFDETMAKRSVR